MRLSILIQTDSIRHILVAVTSRRERPRSSLWSNRLL
jgi:hypothetical protein